MGKPAGVKFPCGQTIFTSHEMGIGMSVQFPKPCILVQGQFLSLAEILWLGGGLNSQMMLGIKFVLHLHLYCNLYLRASDLRRAPLSISAPDKIM